MAFTDATLLSKVRDCPALPPLPAEVRGMLELAAIPGADINDLSRVILQSPSLSGKLVAFANLDFFGKRGSVTSVRSALVLLGVEKVRAVVAGLALAHASAGVCPRGFSGARFRRRAVLAGSAAWVIASRLEMGCEASAFLSAMTMDLGMFALDYAAPEKYSTLMGKIASHGDLLAIEASTLGVTHAQAAGHLAKAWRLPEEVCSAVMHHHDAVGATEANAGQIAQILCTAGRCADAFFDPSPLWAVADARRHLSERFGVADARCNRIMREIGEKANALCPLFDLAPESRLTYDRVARRAKEQLHQVVKDGAAGPKSSEQRSVPRIKRDTDVFVIPCTGSTVGGSVRAHLRDVSARGIGLRYSEPMPTGSRFIFRLHKAGGQWTTLLYEVVRSRNVWGGFDIGAKLLRVLKDESAATMQAPTDANGQSENSTQAA
jgi:HD-like signal output (HDOD) protein